MEKRCGKSSKIFGEKIKLSEENAKYLVNAGQSYGEWAEPEDLCYLTGTYLEDYLHDVEICQRFAKRNREKMAEILLEKTGLTAGESFHTVHNYIDTDGMILRKGSIAAHEGEKVLIPINMRDGCLIFECLGHNCGDDEIDMAVSDNLALVIDSITFNN